MTAPMRRVAVRPPPSDLVEADPEEWHYQTSINLARARDQHEAFVSLLRDHGIAVEVISKDPDQFPDSVFTHDASIVTREGAVLMRMGKRLRAREPALHKSYYAKNGIPILGEIVDGGQVEAGDTLWLDEDTLAVGIGHRTNIEGARQLADLLVPQGIRCIPIDMPNFMGPEACLHLMSVVSLLSSDLALVHSKLAPVRLLELLDTSGFRIIAGDTVEFERSGTISLNILTLEPGLCVAVEGAPRTVAQIEAAGCRVLTFVGDELCVKMEGGPTCLTRSIWRE